MKNKALSQAILAGFVLFSLLAVFYYSFLSGQSYIWDDSLYICYPGANYLATSLAAGHIPFWTSGVRDGVPFFSDLAMSAMYPPLWCLALFVSEGVLPFVAYQWYLILQLLMGGVFTVAFLRLMGLRYYAALAGAVVFVFSAHMSLHIIHPTLIQAYIWLPLELYFVKRIFSKPNPFLSGMGLVVSILFSFWGSFPQATLYNSYLLIFYWGFLFWLQRRNKSAGSAATFIKSGMIEMVKIGAVFLTVVLLGAVIFMPAAENWYLSSRQTFGFKEIADLSLPWYYLIHGLVPNFFGSSNGNGSGIPFWGFNKDTIEFRNWHAGAWMYWEFGFYAGQLTLLAITVLVFNFRKVWERRHETAFFLCAVIPILWLMLGRYGYLFDLFYRFIPGFSMFRTPARIGGLLVFCAAVLVAVLVDWVLDKKSSLELRRPLVWVGVLYGIFFLGLMSCGENLFPELKSSPLRTYAFGQTVLSLILCGVMAVVIGVVSRTQKSAMKVTGGMGLVILCFADLYLASHAFHQGKTSPQQYYADKNNLISQMTQMQSRTGPFRFAQLRDGKMSEEIVFPRNNGYMHPDYQAPEGYLLFNLKELNIFNGIANEQVRLDIQNVGLMANADSAKGRVSLALYTNSLPRVKFYHQIKAFENSESVCAELGSGRLDYRHTVGVLRDDIVKYGVKIQETSPGADAEVRFISQTPDTYQISYRTTAPGIIFISESFYPGWEADEGRYPIIRAFGAFKGIVISEAGSGVITVGFSPHSFKMGLAVSLTTLALLVMAFLVSVRRKSMRPGQLREPN